MIVWEEIKPRAKKKKLDEERNKLKEKYKNKKYLWVVESWEIRINVLIKMQNDELEQNDENDDLKVNHQEIHKLIDHQKEKFNKKLKIRNYKKFLWPPPKLTEQTDLTIDELSTVARIPNTNRNRLISNVEFD